MKEKPYELIEHTADVGIRVKAHDLKELFRNAALAMFDIIAEERNLSQKQQQVNIQLQAGDREELLITWLNELLSLSATKALIFSGFKIIQLTDTSLNAFVSGGSIEDYRVNVEIKAATYHQLSVKELGGEWVAEVIFDV